MTQERIEFGTRLRREREARSLSLDDVAKTTKIPARSLEQLEAGTFESLPADVFVRGFLRSYCRCVGLAAEDTVRAYGELTRGDAKKRELASLAKLSSAHIEEPRAVAAGSPRPIGANDEDGDAEASRRGAKVERNDNPIAQLAREALSDAGRGTRRASLTLAVIILVIVATLTLSLLLRRPSHVGDGLSLDTTDAPAAARG